jgi:kynurenine formamidase
MSRFDGPETSQGFPSYAELKARTPKDRGLAWGVFGDKDQIGTLNHLTPGRVRKAALSVREGLRFNLNLSLTEFDPPIIAHRGVVKHEVFGLNEFHRDDRVDSLFPQSSTQLDSLRHFAHPDYGFYNGFSGSEIVTGTATLGIQNVAEQTIAGRGILVDLERFFRSTGRPLDHAASQQVTPAQLEDAMKWQGTVSSPGDILLLRFGWIQYKRNGTFAHDALLTSAGLEQSEAMAAWLWDHQFSVVAADNIAVEAWPADSAALPTEAETNGDLCASSHTGMLHRILIPLLGLTLGELWDLDDLAGACAERGRYDSLIVAEPLNLFGGVGSPANAVALM